MASQSLYTCIGLVLVACSTAPQLTSLPLQETITIASARFIVDPQNPVLHGTPVSAGGPAIMVDGQSVSFDEADDLYVNRVEVLNGPAKKATTNPVNQKVNSTTRGTSIFSQPPSVLKAAITSSGSGNLTYLPNTKSKISFLGADSRLHKVRTNSKTLSVDSSIYVPNKATGSSAQIANGTTTPSLGTLITPKNLASLLKPGVDQVKLGSGLQTSARSTLSVSTLVASTASDWKSLNSMVTSPAALTTSTPSSASKPMGHVVSSTKANGSVDITESTGATTSASSTGLAEISDAIVLGAALMKLSSSASRAGSNILEQPTKDAFIQSIDSLKPKLKGLGGIDTSGSCAGLKKRRGRWQRNLISNILNALSNSCGSLVTIANLLKGNTPNLAAIDQQWNIVGASAEELQSSADSGDSDDNDEDDKQTQASQDGKPTKSAEGQESKTLESLRTISLPAYSQTSMRRSSSISQIASAPDKIGYYSGTEYAYPASYSAPASATNAIFGVLSLAILAHVGAYVPDVTASAINATMHTTNKATSSRETSFSSNEPRKVPATVSLSTLKSNDSKDFGPDQDVSPSTKPVVPKSADAVANSFAEEIAGIAYLIAKSEGVTFPRTLITDAVPVSAALPAIAAHSAPSLAALTTASRQSSPNFLTSSTVPAPHRTPGLVQPLMCTLLEEILLGGGNPYYIHTCNCNDGSKPRATRSGEAFACPSQVDIILVG